jgi:predicted metal-dependent peptidase
MQTYTHKYSAKQVLERTRAIINTHPRLIGYASTMMAGDSTVVPDAECPTACTDGLNTRYGESFTLSYSRNLHGALCTKALVFIVMHETLHKKYRHLIIWRDIYTKNPTLANKACDYFVNGLLMAMLAKYPELNQVMAMPLVLEGERVGEMLGLYSPRFAGLDSKKIYDTLKSDEETNTQNNEPDEPDTGEDTSDEEVNEGESGEETGGDVGDKEGSAGEGEGKGQGEGAGDEPVGWDTHDFAAAKEWTSEELANVEQTLDRAERSGVRIAERVGGTIPVSVDDSDDGVDWVEEMREFVRHVSHGGSTFTYRKFNRKVLGLGLYQPSLASKRMGKVAVFIDTSGSTAETLVNRFLANVRDICIELSPTQLDIVYWDDEIRGVETYTEYDGMVEETCPLGGNTTDPTCITRYMQTGGYCMDGVEYAGDCMDGVECAIIFTDAYFNSSEDEATFMRDWPQDVPLLWAVWDERGPVFEPEVGRVIVVAE